MKKILMGFLSFALVIACAWGVDVVIGTTADGITWTDSGDGTNFYAVFGGGAPAPWVDPNAANLVLLWSFDPDLTNETGKVNDDSGNGHDGTLEPTPATGPTLFITGTNALGVANNAVSFDGTEDRIITTSDASLKELTEITFGCWTTQKVAGLMGCFGQWAAAETNRCWTFYTASDDPIWAIGNGGASSDFSTTYDLNSAEWIHVAMTYKNSEGVRETYINGVLTATNVVFTGTMNTNGSECFAGMLRPDSYFWNGSGDEYFVYNKKLTSNDIYTLQLMTHPTNNMRNAP